MRRLFLSICLLTLGLLVASRPAALAADKSQQDLFQAMVADTDDIATGLGQIQLFKDAGFIYQPAMSLCEFVSPRGDENADWRSVVLGMMVMDRAHAFFFGSVEDVEHIQKVILQVTDGFFPKGAVPKLTANQIRKLQQEMETEAGRKRLAQLTTRGIRTMLEKVGQDEHNLRILGGYLYGVFIERLYLAGVMYLAAVEEGTADALASLKLRSASNLTNNVKVLADKGLLGDAKETKARAAILHKLNALVPSGRKINLDHLRMAVAICEDVRDDFYTGSQP